jgi:L,D-peptidoglycan transpeptidase YkuD (ErfK/YbiS/YcfS/YnhG family)
MGFFDAGSRPRPLRSLTVAPLPGCKSHGRLTAGAVRMPCALGRMGLTTSKREGDGATPVARHRIETFLLRRDRLRPPALIAPAQPMRPKMGWCDDPGSGSYNRPVCLPCRAGHEDLWREDSLYDVVGVLDWNRRPRVGGRGSAIFLHLARPDFAPTAGCVAIAAADMRRLLPRLARRCMVDIRR